MMPASLRTINCVDCGAKTTTRWARQKYCAPCSEKRHLQYKVTAKGAAKRVKSEARIAGRQISDDSAKGISDIFDELPPLSWLSVIAFPFTYELSKNGLWSQGQKRGHVFIRQKVKDLRSQLTMLIRSNALRDGRAIYEGKVWIYIHVQKPDARGDAVNVVDLVCDAVKDAIDIDDRWFSIRRLDWEVVKTDPQIYIGVGQEKLTEHHRICSYCGRDLPASMFSKKKADRLGIGRECKDCRHRKPKKGKAA